MLWAAFKSIFSVTAILGVMVSLGILHSHKIWLAWPILILVGVTFSSLALIFNALAKGYDFFTYYFTLFLTPMTFLSGVFFPREQLPAWVQPVAAFLPLSQAIDLVRPLFLDQWPQNASWHLLFLLLTALTAYGVALQLTKRRFFKS
jgi:lipooligosaccharide transport system permease protein